MIDAALYFLVAHATFKLFASDDMKTIRFQTQNESGLISDGDANGQIDQWQLANLPLGVAEVADIFPGGRSPYVPGYEYYWGTHSMKVGDKINRSTGITYNGQKKWGYESVTLAAVLPSWTVPAGTYKDVIVIDSLQYWCTNLGANCGPLILWHSKFYLAKGVGIIEQDWLQTPNGPGTIKAKVIIQTP